MPFIPHTEKDINEMLNTIGVKSIDDLFDEIPKNLRVDELSKIPPGMNEMEISRLMHERAKQDEAGLCFIGAGAYEHHIPAPLWQIAGRGEFMTAYTPYQAEASQGTLQTIYEYQTMIANLTGLDIANASLYDGASAVAEAVLMSIRANRHSKSKKILMPKAMHPTYRKTTKTTTEPQESEFIEIPYDSTKGNTNLDEFEKFSGQDITAVIIAQPNFFGVLEEVDAITDWAHQHGALVIAVCNPLALSILKEPGAWGKNGADIAVGDGQPLGCPLSSGGPYFGYMVVKKELMRTMPGRVIGRTTDSDGNDGFVLTLQAREQHIRRSKATSNICTNQGLMVIAATMYMSLMGATGMQQAATLCHANATLLREQLIKTKQAKNLFSGAIFNEFVLQLNKPTNEILNQLAEEGIQGGFDLSRDYPELGNALLVCATETKNKKDLTHYASAFEKIGAYSWQK